MTKFPAILLALVVCAAIFSRAALAQPADDIVIQQLNQVLPNLVSDKVQYQLGNLQYDLANHTAIGTNGVYINYGHGAAVLTADNVVFNYQTGAVDADGNVRIESENMLWVGEHIRYNFKTHLMTSEQFRAGHLPVFVTGAQLTGFLDSRKGATNEVIARHAYLTTDDYSEPAYQVRATTIRIIPGKKVEMWNAVAYVEGVPVFYFPLLRAQYWSAREQFHDHARLPQRVWPVFAEHLQLVCRRRGGRQSPPGLPREPRSRRRAGWSICIWVAGAMRKSSIITSTTASRIPAPILFPASATSRKTASAFIWAGRRRR